MNANYSVGDYLIQRLTELGVGHMFSIAGDYTAEFVTNYVGPSAIQVIEEVNEVNAGYAADAYARLNGISAACFTYSAGALCAVNAVAGAYVERVPMVLINGSPSIQKRQTIEQTPFVAHHMVKGNTDFAIFDQITVSAVQVDNPELAPNMIDLALTRCISEKRPVYIELLEDMVSQPCTPPQSRIAPFKSICDNQMLEQATDLITKRLKAAKFPLIWLGPEIDRFGLQDLAKSLIDKFNVPYATEFMAKAVLSEEDSQFIGVFDGDSSASETIAAFQKSDFVLALGIWLSDINSLGDGVNFYDNICLVATDTVRYSGEFFSQVSVGQLMERLMEAEIPKFKTTTSYTPILPPCPDQNASITYQGFYDFIRHQDSIDENCLIGSDASLNYFGAIPLKLRAPQSYVVQPNYSSIGYIGPAATAMCLLQSEDQRVIVFAGDGGFQMSAQCLSTQTRFGLNPIIFVIDNGVYGVEQWLYDASVFTSDAKFLDACVLHRWQYSKLADVFGCKGWTAHTYAELSTALDGAMANTDSPSIIQVCIPSKSIPENAKWKKS